MPSIAQGTIMPIKDIAVFGIYHTPNEAERAVDHLLAAGFAHANISVLLPEESAGEALRFEKHTRAPEGAATGATAGGVVGGTLGLLAGVGLLAIPGFGPLLAIGPILAALAGLGVGGTVGGMVGSLVGMGIPEYEARRYESHVKEGGLLLSVHCISDVEMDLAKESLRATGAGDIAATEEPSPEVMVPDGAIIRESEG
jgi:hypothetical protein